jgi:CBS-domain-containing membrane protein
VTIFIVLCVLDTLAHTVLIAALGASSFIAFTMPHTNSARPRYLVGGYVVGMIVGCSASVMGCVFIGLAADEFQHILAIAFAAAATGGAMFMMTITDTEHPPAAGLALGFAVNEWDILTVAVVFIGVSRISLTKEVFKARLKHLL